MDAGERPSRWKQLKALEASERGSCVQDTESSGGCLMGLVFGPWLLGPSKTKISYFYHCSYIVFTSQN